MMNFLDMKHSRLPERLKPFVLEKARHEFGHLVAARVLGFRTGDIELKILDERGDHFARSEIMLNRPLNTMEEALSFLEARITILFCGVLSEAPDQTKQASKALKSGKCLDLRLADDWMGPRLTS